MPDISAADYIELVDFTGREWHTGKPGKIEASEPKALTKLGLDKNHWTTRVKGIGLGYWRVVGELEFGVGFARILNKIYDDIGLLFSAHLRVLGSELFCLRFLADLTL